MEHLRRLRRIPAPETGRYIALELAGGKMSRRMLVFAGFFIVCASYGAHSEEMSPAVRDAFEEISEELNTYYGYYLIGGQCATNAHATDAVKENEKLEAYVLGPVVNSRRMERRASFRLVSQ
jgi:hypothetical protein